jgi:hypothetical protein
MTNRPLMSPQQPSFEEAGYAVAGGSCQQE